MKLAGPLYRTFETLQQSWLKDPMLTREILNTLSSKIHRRSFRPEAPSTLKPEQSNPELLNPTLNPQP